MSVTRVVFGGVQHIQHTSAFDKHAQSSWRSLSHMLTVHWFPWGRMRTITLQALIATHARWLVQITTTRFPVKRLVLHKSLLTLCSRRRKT